MITKENIAYIVSEMRTLNRPLTVAEAEAQVAARGFEGQEAHDIVLRVLGLIAAQEFEAARMARLLGSERLRNGAVVIATKPSTRYPGNRVALCEWGDEGYVTWLVDAQGDACWGHYHQGDLEAAAADFKARK